MRVGIPRYRLPAEVLDKEIKAIESFGVEIKVNSRIDSLDDLFTQGYDVIFIGSGAHRGTSMGIEGETVDSVIDGVDFLRDINLGNEANLGEKVLVIGGGNVAIDAARTALREGVKEVTILYRRTRAEMPAADEEIEEALEEGVKIEYLAAPTKAMSVNGRLQVESIRMQLGRVDQSGRRRPEPMEGSEFTTECNTMIKAIGQESVTPDSFNVTAGRGGRIEVDADTMGASREGVFAGGDVVSGPASVIEAIADGRRAAIAMDKYLGGDGNIDEVLAPPEEESAPFNVEEVEGEKHRPPIKLLPVDQRITCYALAALGFDGQQAVEETNRCLRCDLEEH